MARLEPRPADERKSRGAFFTPVEICEFLAQWAVRSRQDLVLEPSCGEAAFLVSAAARLRSLGVNGSLDRQLRGIEIHALSAKHARRVLEGEGLTATVDVGDFFGVPGKQQYDAVLGNPPYVRYQEFTGDARARSRAAALAHGVRLTGLASSWAAFVVQASAHLKESGRLALVLPAELMTVNYAEEIRRFLLDRFAVVRLAVFDQRVFPGVTEEVVLLLAEGRGPTDHLWLHQLRDLTDLERFAEAEVRWTPQESGDKWLAALVPRQARACYRTITAGPDFGTLSLWGATHLGMVTGNNGFFARTEGDVRRIGVPAHELVRISPPGSRHLRGLSFTASAWRAMAASDQRAYLLFPDLDERRHSAAVRSLLTEGEREGVNLAYKCRVRAPWWRVPGHSVPDLFFTYMNHEVPRLCANRARVAFLNSVHGVQLRPGLRRLGMDLVPLAALNTVTLLGAELVGRAYGGGILKLEPKEAAQLPMPSPSLISASASALRRRRGEVARLLREGELTCAVHIVDEILLKDKLNMPDSDVAVLRDGRNALLSRRVQRGE